MIAVNTRDNSRCQRALHICVYLKHINVLRIICILYIVCSFIAIYWHSTSLTRYIVCACVWLCVSVWCDSGLEKQNIHTQMERFDSIQFHGIVYSILFVFLVGKSFRVFSFDSWCFQSCVEAMTWIICDQKLWFNIKMCINRLYMWLCFEMFTIKTKIFSFIKLFASWKNVLHKNPIIVTRWNRMSTFGCCQREFPIFYSNKSILFSWNKIYFNWYLSVYTEFHW